MVSVAFEPPVPNIEIPYPFCPEVVTVLLDTVIVELTLVRERREFCFELSASPAALLPEVVTVLPVIEMVPPELAKAPKPSTPVVVIITFEASISPFPFACIPGPIDVVMVTVFNVRIGGGGTVTVFVI
jgi:hypothetical protein